MATKVVNIPCCEGVLALLQQWIGYIKHFNK